MNDRASLSALWEKMVRGSVLASVLFLGYPLFAAQSGQVRTARAANEDIRTGAKSPRELILADHAIARLGANTTVRLADGGRTLNLTEGAVLFQVPEWGAGIQISTGTIVATSTRATGLIERHSRFYMKLLILEGEARVSVPSVVGESIVMQPGQILITKPDVTSLPDPAYFDIARLMKTCRLVSEFRPLASKDLIRREEQKQTELTSKGSYIPSNLVIFGRGTLVTLVPPQPAISNEHKAATSPRRTN